AEGVSKAGGGLFARLLADHPDIPPARILHLGDDPLGDVAMARAAGLRAFHYVPGPGLGALRERERAVAGLGGGGWDGLAPRRAAASG
ncbi:MAG: HAD hydrolase-like protein, partial [Niveispirillum sp.]|uniref:HAD hydrolase-like protein n=1 Tax=Niveispirillum sp. TaxID=1917217 RepID=UPI004035A7E1